ncbi:hypothetical protein D1007_37408 [Hordeum vulgare]|nr:hypothetical protein D1007_37408 [Hordeum vulgare]
MPIFFLDVDYVRSDVFPDLGTTELAAAEDMPWRPSSVVDREVRPPLAVVLHRIRTLASFPTVPAARISGVFLVAMSVCCLSWTNRQTNKSVINWEEHHMIWVDMWNAQRDARVENDQTPDTDEATYLRHLEWMRTEYRVIHKKVANRCRTLAALLSCHSVSSTDVRARAQYVMDVQSSARPCASRPRASSARPSSSRARASSSRAHVEEFEEEEEESDNEAADPDFIEFGASQMEDAPQPSQPTQATEETCRASSRNVRRPGWQNTPEGYVTKDKMAAKRGRK